MQKKIPGVSGQSMFILVALVIKGLMKKLKTNWDSKMVSFFITLKRSIVPGGRNGMNAYEGL
jgi:hypothetical protein